MKKGNVFRKVIAGIGVAILLLGLTACGQGGNSAANITEADIIGEYVETDDYAVNYISLQEGGAFISDITTSMGLTTHTENTWDYVDGTLTLHYLEYGVDSKYSVSFKDNTMILDNGTAQRELVRK